MEKEFYSTKDTSGYKKDTKGLLQRYHPGCTFSSVSLNNDVEVFKVSTPKGVTRIKNPCM